MDHSCSPPSPNQLQLDPQAIYCINCNLTMVSPTLTLAQGYMWNYHTVINIDELLAIANNITALQNPEEVHRMAYTLLIINNQESRITGSLQDQCPS